MRVEEFKFQLFDKYKNTVDIYEYWSKIIDKYFQQIYGITGKLIVHNLKYSQDNGQPRIEYEKGNDNPNSGYNSNYALCTISPHKGCLKIEYLTTIENYHKFIHKSGETNFDDEEKTEYNAELFSFLIYGQNDCCGALSTSKTIVDLHLRNRKLGTILQYFKEDIARYQGTGLLTCTDTYFKQYQPIIHGSLEELKPYLENTKLLLNTGWTVSKLFFNKNSNNVVGLFTKNVKSITEIKNLEIIMKIKINNSGLVKIDTEKVTIGCDPELFLKSNETGEYVPSFFVMEGDKNNPTPIGKEGHNIQCDNVMVEYGVPPSTNVEDFVKHNLFVQKYIKEEIADKNNLKMIIFPSARFEEQNLLDERAQRFGCDPDYDAHNQSVPNTVGNTKTPWRCAGGHIHVGYENHNYYTNVEIVRAMDLFLSVPLVLMEPENKRKEMYGKAGAYRHQNHGVEYRVTSNYIFSSEELMRWAYEQTIKALKFVNSADFKKFNEWYSVITAINTKDEKMAKSLIETHKAIGVCTLETSDKLIKS